MYCARCFEEITRPHWHEGKPYGATCIEIVGGKATSKPSVWVEVHPDEAVRVEALASRGMQPWRIRCGNRWYHAEIVYCDELTRRFFVNKKYLK